MNLTHGHSGSEHPTRAGLRTVRLGCWSLFCVLLIGCGGLQEPPPHAGEWVRLDALGRPLTDGSGSRHDCALDLRTGLMWEVKRAEAGLHDRDDTYTWSRTDVQIRTREPGLDNGGKCPLERCDAEAFVAAVNEQGLCGYHDWRLPHHTELLTLGDRRFIGEALVIDPALFPNTVPGEYWSASVFRLYPGGAWAVDTRTGLDRVDLKSVAKAVRLVRTDLQGAE